MQTDSSHSLTVVLSELDGEDPEAIHRRGEELKQQELERAYSRLTARGGFTKRQHEILSDMASAIVDGILVAPDSMMERASEPGDNSIRTAIELFSPDR